MNNRPARLRRLGRAARLRLGAKAFVLCASFLLPLAASPAGGAHAGAEFSARQTIPPVPDDIRDIYFTGADGKLVPLPFEEATSSIPFEWDEPAERSRTGYVELKGEHAKTVLDAAARFYVFVLAESNVPPPFIVRLKVKNGARRMTAVVEKDKKWFAPLAEEVVVPRYRVIDKVYMRIPRGLLLPLLYVELAPRAPLPPGEYAFVGKGLETTSTFRVAGPGVK